MNKLLKLFLMASIALVFTACSVDTPTPQKPIVKDTPLPNNNKKSLTRLKEDLDTKKKRMMQKSASLKGLDAITRYSTKKELSLETEGLLNDISSISELDKSFKKQKYLDFIAKIKKDFLIESKKLKFYVGGNKNSDRFVTVIENYLVKNGFGITKSKKQAVQIDVRKNGYVKKSNGMKIAILNLDINIFDNNGRIGGKFVTLKEIYNGSNESVYKNASIHLDQDIKDKGINEVIGIKLKMD